MRVEGPRETRAVLPTLRFLRENLSEVNSEWTLNWGSTRNLEGNVIQSPTAVALCSDKARSKMKLFVDGVPTPQPLDPQSARVLVGSSRTTQRLVGRPAQTARGNSFWMCSTPDEVERAIERGATHFAPFIEATKEFRVHVIRQRVVKISEKTGGEGVVRSYRHGWRFMVPSIPTSDREPLRTAAKAAVRSLGLDMGAADVLWRDGAVWVCEVNAAPSLTDESSNTGAKYVRWIKEVWA